MVKGYDPTASDPSKILLEYLLRWSVNPNPLPLQQAQKYIKYWLKNSQSTSQIYKKFNSLPSNQQPEIVLKNKCTNFLSWSFLKLLFLKENPTDESYPAYTQNNQLIVCLNLVKNKTELKENIDRQLTILWKNAERKVKTQTKVKVQTKGKMQNKGKMQTKGKSQIKTQQNLSKSLQNKQLLDQVQQSDKELMQSLLEGCRQGYKNYMFDDEVQERISKKCAKYLFFRRCQRQLPLDAKFRYASKIIQQVV